ncbi:MAG: TadE/TadG family type IV pilus assembly protein [Marmoricola sp.]
MLLNPARRSREARRRDESGAVAIIVAMCMTTLLVMTGMVLDFGLIRLDRQDLKKSTDSAALSGLAAGDTGTGEIYTYKAVCGALAYLRSRDVMSSLPDGICSPASLSANGATKCSSAPASNAVYDQTINANGAAYRVVIKSPYVLNSDGWSDEDKPTLAADQSTVGGCDQLGVQIFESRKPGLGSLATSSDLRSAVRSAARATIGGGDTVSPALIILERSACSALTVGSAGTNTFIAVKGSGATPGSIHLDSAATGAGCGSGSNQQLVQGKQNDGVVAYGSVSPTGTAGSISSFATFAGVAASKVYDDVNEVYGTASTSGTGTIKNPVTGRDQVTRKPVDTRYRLAVRTAVAGAASVWGNQSGWTVAGCNPTAAQLAVTTSLWVDCPGNSGITLNNKTIQASDIYFNGFIKGGSVAMPNAARVYVDSSAANSASAISLSNNTGFCVRSTCGTTSSDACSAASSPARARLFVRTGSVDASGGTLRLCNTTMLLLGGDSAAGCVPGSDGTAPTTSPCSGSAGSGTLSVTGQTAFDWTAPNEYPGTIPTSSETTAWSNFEDLSLWSESAGLYKFSGGGGMRTVGVYMVPNGSPVNVGGGANQTLTNTQYIARTFSVSGGGTLSLTTDPRNAVTIPAISGYILVR